MEEFRTRPFADDDAAAVADLLNAAEVAHGGEPGFTAGEIRGFAGMLLGDAGGDSRLYLAADGTLVALAFIGAPPPGGAKADLIGSVSPDFEGRGLGRALLTWQLDRVAAMRSALAPGAQWHAELGIGSENTAGIRLIERVGGTPVRYGVQMEAEAANVLAVPIPDGFRVVPYTEAIGRALHAAHSEAFGDHWGFQARPFDNWAPGAIHSDVFRGDLSRIAYDGDDIAAYVLAYDGVAGSVYIGQVGTRRPWRKRGLASALLSASVRAGFEAGKTNASLGVDADSPTGAVGVYERLGFEVRHKVVVFHWTVAYPMVDEMQIRPYVESDAEAVADLMNTIDAEHGAEAGWTGGELRSFIKAWVRDPATDSRLVITPDGALAAVGIVSPPPDGGQRADMFGGVHPDHQGRGLGRELLAWQYERVRHLHTAIAPVAPWHVETGASVDDQAAIRLFERLGFGPVRYFFEMVAPLGGQRHEMALPDGLVAESYMPELAKPLYEAHMEAFSDHWGFQRRPYEKWVIGTVESEEFRPDLTRIAFDGDQIAGYVLAYDNVEGREYIGQVGTRRPWRKRGLASALISASLAAAVADGKSSASLGVDADSPTGAVGVYERLGFEVKHKFVSYRRSVE